LSIAASSSPASSRIWICIARPAFDYRLPCESPQSNDSKQDMYRCQ
jgi:hypothetical protein